MVRSVANRTFQPWKVGCAELFVVGLDSNVPADGVQAMPPGTAEEDRLPPRSENQGFRRDFFTFFSNPGTPNPSKFEISRKFL